MLLAPVETIDNFYQIRREYVTTLEIKEDMIKKYDCIIAFLIVGMVFSVVEDYLYIYLILNFHLLNMFLNNKLYHFLQQIKKSLVKVFFHLTNRTFPFLLKVFLYHLKSSKQTFLHR